MDKGLEEDLHKALEIMSVDWPMQKKIRNKETGFIYKADSLQKCLEMIEQNKGNKEYDYDFKEYALHRWYNYQTSVMCEYIFCEYGAVHDPDPYNHDVDIRIAGREYDVKLTVYPKALPWEKRDYYLGTREGKDELVRWFYDNQSQEDRKQMLNRLYVVCDGSDDVENMAMKCDLALMRKRIAAYMDYEKSNGQRCGMITDKATGKKHRLFCDLIRLNREIEQW